MRIGVLGGTFDPIHLAHIAIARCALEEYSLDQVWFMPAGDPYFKEHSKVTDAALRLAMTRDCVRGLGDPRFECSDLEIQDTHHTYTSETFRRLQASFPGDRFYFILGLDSLEALPTWHEPAVLLDNAVILCALRPLEEGGAQEEERFDEAVRKLRTLYTNVKPEICRLHCPVMPVSSTMIRERVRRGEEIKGLVTPETEAFIRSCGLYKG